MGFLEGLLGFVGEVVKDSTGVDIGKEINNIKDGGSIDDVLYDVKGDMEGTAYKKFREQLRRLSNEDFKRLRTDNYIDVQMRAYEDEKRRRL